MGINIQLLEKVERLRREERDVIKKKIKDNEFYKILKVINRKSCL